MATSVRIQAQRTLTESQPGHRDRLLLIAFGSVFAILSVMMNVLSTGFLEADGITHYLYARHAFDAPWVFVDVWGRPTVKLLHAPLAAAGGTVLGHPTGLVLVRLVSLMMAIGGAIVTWRVATKLPMFHQRAALVFVCALGSPLVFLHSFSVLTELPFGFLMVICLWAYARQRWVVLALVAGLLPATRPEGIGFVLMIVGGLVLHRRWLALPLVALGPITWATAGWMIAGSQGSPITGPFLWLASAWPYSEESTYASGQLLKFVGMLPAAVGPMLFPFVVIGLVVAYRQWRGWRTEHEVRVGLVIALVPTIVIVVHSLLHWTGKMASSGDVRYLLAVSPFWALLAARGLEATWQRLRLRGLVPATLAFILVPIIVLQAFYPIVPIREDDDAQLAREVAQWWLDDAQAELRATHPHLQVDHPVFRLAAGTTPFSSGTTPREIAEARPPGSVYLWHVVYSQYNADFRYTVPVELPPASGWRDITPQQFRERWRFFVSDP